MQKLVIVLMFAIVMAACNNNGKSTGVVAASKDTTYTITGKVKGLDSGWVYLYHMEKEEEAPDSVKITNGSFEFKGALPQPQLTLLGFNENGQKQFPLGFFLENGKITINGEKDSLYKAVINGSSSQEEFKKFNELRKPVEEKQKQLYEQYQVASMSGDAKKVGEIQQQYEALDGESKAVVVKFVKENPSSYVSAFILTQAFPSDAITPEVEPLYNALAENIKASHFGKTLKESIDGSKKTAVGSPAPEFTLNDVNGKPVSLSSYKGKYTLVDFWASWCGPCRQENPTVVKAYNTFKSKGFDILGVSLDEKKESWEKAIQQDKLSWTHVSDLKGWKSDAASLYGIRAIPMNYLLDKDGKIIAKSLRGEDLLKKLGELLN